MTKADYITKLFDAFIDNENFYEQSVLRIMHFAKKEFMITNYEFLTRSVELVNTCINKSEENHVILLKDILPKIKRYNETKNSKEYTKDDLRYFDEIIKMSKSEPNFSYPSEVTSIHSSNTNTTITISKLNAIKHTLKKIYNQVLLLKGDKNLDYEETLFLIEGFNTSVFKSKLASLLFERYVKEFKDNNKKQAIFSFFYDTMNRLGLIHCSAPIFIKELDKYAIVLDRIDSNQCYSPSNPKATEFKYIYKDIFGCFPDI
ncbi:hypothetical protein ACGK9U_01395 [Mariniflexile sp. HNIBRBA6329]|uniref:hypothetical protein n=1 Tax=Mariniflexile sp. HNIBRBA6329 TaxID=3373088 RepID=UPI003746553D